MSAGTAGRRPGSWAREVWTAWGVMLAFCLLIAAYSGLTLASGGEGSGVASAMFLRSPLGTAIHIVAGMTALVGGALQFVPAIRLRYRRVHRGIGMAYVAGVALGGMSGLIASFHSHGGAVTHLGFGTLAILWLGTTAAAFVAIRQGDVLAHRRWMTRSYALTLAAVMLRIYIPASLVAGVPFDEAYRAISWLCWAPNLVIAELWFMPRRVVGFA